MPTVEQARYWYRSNDPVHGFDHILRVRALALHLARALKADVRIVEAAALLHDASGGDAKEGERSSHHEASSNFARKVLQKENWSQEDIEQVVACIRAHRYRGGDEAQTLEAQILYDADKLDVLGAFGAARTIAYAVEAGQPIFARPSKIFLSTGQGEPGEAHSAYHEYIFKLSKVKQSLHTEEAQALAQERESVMATFFEALASEDTFAQNISD